MVNHKQDIKAIDEFFLHSRASSTACVVRQADGSYSEAHQMCFGGLARLIRSTSKYIVNGIQFNTAFYKSLPEEDKIFFLDYLMNESPFKDCFIEHDAKRAIQDCLTQHRIDLPGNLVIGGLSAVREMWESYSLQGLPYFTELVDTGCPKDFAWIVCQYITDATNKQLFLSHKYSSGHGAWPSGEANISYVINYINHKIPGVHTTNFSPAYPYTGVFNLFSGRDITTKFSSWMLDNASNTEIKVEVKQPWDTVTPPKQKILKLTKEKMIDQIVVLSEKFYREFKEHIK